MNWFRQHRFQKLDYKELKVEDVVFNVARSSSRSMHITCKQDGKLYAVCNYTASQDEFVKFLRDHITWAKESMKKMKDDLHDTFSKKIDKEEKEKLRKKLEIYVNQYETLMNTKVNKWTIYDMKTRWGSCTSNEKNIRFSIYLSKCSDEFIEYVVVHEMAHIFVPNHKKKFWDIVEQYLPDFKKRRRMYVSKEGD